MTDPTVFDLLTQEYSLILATDDSYLPFIKEVRRKTLLRAYSKVKEVKDEENFLYNSDDEQSFIYLLRHNPSNTYVGTVRLFFVNDKTPVKTIPLQTYGVQGVEHLVSRYPVCEVSRLGLIPDLPPHQELSMLRLRNYLTMGLMSSIGINAFLYHTSNIFSIMELSLYRILKRQGIDFHPIGSAVEYYGMRVPHMIKRDALIENSTETLKTLTLFYLQELCHTPEKLWHYIDAHPYLDHHDIHLDSICELFKKFGDKTDIPLLLRYT